MKCIFAVLITALTFCMLGCESSESRKPSQLPTRATDGGDLPWGRPASWEGGLPGMGGVSNPASNRF